MEPDMSSETSIGLNDLIEKIKQELKFSHTDTDLFFVEEVNLEINFVVSGDIKSGFNVGIVTLGSDINEQRVQKIAVKLTPIISKDELRERISSKDIDTILASSSKSLLKGGGQIK